MRPVAYGMVQDAERDSPPCSNYTMPAFEDLPDESSGKRAEIAQFHGVSGTESYGTAWD